MKKSLCLLLLFYSFLFVFHSSAQAPQGMNYQAVARDAGGAILANQSISIFITITDSISGLDLYSETHSPVTNQFGLFTLNIGSGLPVKGTFPSISWGTVKPWMQIEMDPSGGTNYMVMGNSQLLSVPYALYAGSSGDNKYAFRAEPGFFSQVITNGNEDTIHYSIPVFNHGNIYDSVSHVFTVPATGVYYIGASLTASPYVNTELRIYKNNKILLEHNNANNSPRVVVLSAIYQLSAGDKVYVTALQYNVVYITVNYMDSYFFAFRVY